MKLKERYVCWVPVKPYVKQFLLHNFNDPDDKWQEIVNLSSDKELQKEFLSRLDKNGRWENKYKDLKKYSSIVPIEIKKDNFYRFGWSMSNSEVVSFGVKIEHRIKAIFFIYVDSCVSMGIPISTSIRCFQEKFKFTEEIWSYDTMRREYNRHSLKVGSSTKNNILEYIHSIIMGNLSGLGTTSNKAKKLYAND